MIISILNQKGGCGKTTLAINLARYFTKKKETTILFDSDPQGSTMDWHEKSKGELLDVICLPRVTLEKDIQKFLPLYKWIFIDGIPQISDITSSAIKCSDVVLIPVQPSPYDIWASSEIVELIETYQNVNKGRPKTAFVVSRKIANTKLGKDVHESLQGYNIHVFKSFTSQRVIYPHSANLGLTVLDMGNDAKEAANEIEEIAKELEDFAYVDNRNQEA